MRYGAGTKVGSPWEALRPTKLHLPSTELLQVHLRMPILIHQSQFGYIKRISNVQTNKNHNSLNFLSLKLKTLFHSMVVFKKLLEKYKKQNWSYSHSPTLHLFKYGILLQTFCCVAQVALNSCLQAILLPLPLSS